MRKQTVCIAGLALLGSLLMSSAEASANPIPNLVIYARYFVAADVIQHYPMGLQQDTPVLFDDQQSTTSPPLPNPGAQPADLSREDVVVISDRPRGHRGGNPAPRQGARVRRERLRP